MGTRQGRRRHPPTPSTATDSAATLAVALAAVTGGRGTTPLSDCPRRTDREYGIMHLPTRDGPGRAIPSGALTPSRWTQAGRARCALHSGRLPAPDRDGARGRRR